MRSLLLLRHAKSSWNDPSLPDHDRPLAARGVRAARRMATLVDAEGVRPDLVLCSSARRARETLDLVIDGLGDPTTVVDDRLYGADATELMDRVRAVGRDVASLMLLGHNPGLHDLAVALAADGDDAALAQLETAFPTAALAALDFEGSSWADIGPGQAYLTRLVLPKQLR